MKSIFLTLALSTLFTANAQATPDWDGCYQLYMPSTTMYPVVCLDGTNEESINGAGVRMVIFHTNTNMISACAVSSALRGSNNSLEFILGSNKEMILSNVQNHNGRFEGKALFGKSQLNFIQVDQANTKRLLQKFYSEPKCKNVRIGSMIRLR